MKVLHGGAYLLEGGGPGALGGESTAGGGGLGLGGGAGGAFMQTTPAFIVRNRVGLRALLGTPSRRTDYH